MEDVSGLIMSMAASLNLIAKFLCFITVLIGAHLVVKLSRG